MDCPKFQDYSRSCMTDVEHLPLDVIDFCASELHKECPFYILLEKTGISCENLQQCVAFRFFGYGSFENFRDMTKKYCLSENKINCQRYIIKKSGVKPPDDLLPDGTKVKIEKG